MSAFKLFRHLLTCTKNILVKTVLTTKRVSKESTISPKWQRIYNITKMTKNLQYHQNDKESTISPKWSTLSSQNVFFILKFQFFTHLLLILIQSAQTNMFLFSRSELILFKLHHKYITAFHYLWKIGFQPISPETALLGVYLGSL